MNFFRKSAILLGFLVAMSTSVFAQDISSQLKLILDENKSGYLEPFASSLGAGLNSGLYHSADLHSVLGFDIGVKLGLVQIAGQHKSFDFIMPAKLGTLTRGVDYVADVPNAPTFAGSKTGINVTKLTNPGLGSVIFTTPGGFDFSSFPLFAPQASIGLPFGLEVIGRFLPSTKVGDVGKVNFAGFGLRHDIDQYIPFCPVDIAVHFMTQTATLNDNAGNKVMSLGGTAFGAEVSKSLLILTVYGGFQIESSKLSVEQYDYVDPVSSVHTTISGFTLNGADKSRALVGVRFLLAVINIHADYSFSKYPIATAGVGITFR